MILIFAAWLSFAGTAVGIKFVDPRRSGRLHSNAIAALTPHGPSRFPPPTVVTFADGAEDSGRTHLVLPRQSGTAKERGTLLQTWQSLHRSRLDTSRSSPEVLVGSNMLSPTLYNAMLPLFFSSNRRERDLENYATALTSEVAQAAETEAMALTFTDGKTATISSTSVTNPKRTTEPARDSNNMFSFDLSQLKMAQLGLGLWAMCVAAVCGAVAFESFHLRFAGVDLSRDIEVGNEAHQSSLSCMFSGVWPLVRPYLFQQGNTRRQWYYISAITALGFWNLILGLIFTLWMKEFWDVMEKKEGNKFFGTMRDFSLLVTTMILVGVYQSYLSMMLVIHWRRWMTQWLLGCWLKSKSYYHLQLSPCSATLDNPDQRLQEDINRFIPTLLGLVSGFADSVGQLVSNLPLLLILSPTQAFGVFYCPGWLLYLALIYSGLGTIAAHLIGSRLIFINFALQKCEADFRYSIVQVRDHAESIALYGSEDCERNRMEGRFESIIRVWWMMMLYTKRLSFFTQFYMQTSVTFPYLVLAPNYFKGQISMGTMFMLFRALASVKGAFDWVLTSYSSLTEFRATADRLSNFRVAVDKSGKTTAVTHLQSASPNSPGSVLSAEAITVRLPSSAGSRVVWNGAGLVAREGEFVLLTAPEGSGKSCFFRALAGIWPDASGTVYMPANVLFVPQRSYIPQGSLKQALAYPDEEGAFTDEDVTRALDAVGLGRVISGRDLAKEANWALMLSGGEQQRMAIAHAVLRRPQILFLDEATSAMGDEGALELYRLLRSPGILPAGAALVTISHDISLLGPMHDSRYSFCANGGVWIKE